MMRHDEEELMRLLELYPIEVRNVSSVGPSRYRIDGPFALYEAQFVQQDSGKVRACISDYVARQGFWRTQRFILNFYHEQIVPLQNREEFFVTDWFVGTPLCVSRTDCVEAAYVLANLHQALEGASATLKHVIANTLAQSKNPVHEFMILQQILKTYWLRLNQENDKTPTLAHWFQEAYNRAGFVIRTIAKQSEQTAGNPCLCAQVCYGISTLQQFIRFKNGRIGVLQTEDPANGSPVIELANLARTAFSHVDVSIVEEMIEGYQNVLPIHQAGADFVRAVCAFPRRLIDFAKADGFKTMDEAALESELLAAEQEARAAHRLLQAIHGAK